MHSSNIHEIFTTSDTEIGSEGSVVTMVELVHFCMVLIVWEANNLGKGDYSPRQKKHEWGELRI